MHRLRAALAMAAAVSQIQCTVGTDGTDSSFEPPFIAVLGVDGAISCDSFTGPVSQTLRQEFGQSAGEISCFTNVYAKWLEQGGARVIGIPFNADSATIDTILDGVNGVLFTGGGLDLFFNQTYTQTAEYIFKRVLEKNDAGIFLPLHGTCMGFQLLHILVARNESVLATYAFDSEDISWPLNLTAEGRSSRMISSAPSDVVDILSSKPVTMNLHHDGIYPSAYEVCEVLCSGGNRAVLLLTPTRSHLPFLTPHVPQQYSALRNFFTVISTNNDRRGTPFVSTVEAIKYPITATQWHPERPQFQWSLPTGLNHSQDAVRAMSWLAHYFVALTRNSPQRMDTPEKQAVAAKYVAYAMKQQPTTSDPMKGTTYLAFAP